MPYYDADDFHVEPLATVPQQGRLPMSDFLARDRDRGIHAQNQQIQERGPRPVEVGRRPHSVSLPIPQQTGDQPPQVHQDSTPTVIPVAKAIMQINSAEAQDVTLHMSLDLDDDLEAALEDMARLRRLGHFKEAFQHADIQVKPFLYHRYVLVQYARLLVEAARFRDLAQLAVDYPPIAESSDVVEQNWLLLLKEAKRVTELDLLGHLHDLVPAIRLRIGANMTSTEVEVMRLSVFVDKDAWLAEEMETAYENLESEGRLWEVCDLIEAWLHHSSADRILYNLMRSVPSDDDFGVAWRLHTLLRDWQDRVPHESGQLALVSLFTILALGFTEEDDGLVGLSCSIEIAKQQAELLVVRHRSQSIHTQPFLHFLVAESLTRNWRSPDDTFTSFFHDRVDGSVIAYGDGISFLRVQHLPLYIPYDQALPTAWSPRRDDDAIHVLRTVLEAASALGDDVLTMGCLTHLIIRGAEDTANVCSQLEQLFQAAGHRAAHLRCLLFKYLLVRRPEDRERLRLQILEVGDSDDDMVSSARLHLLGLLYGRSFGTKVLGGKRLERPKRHTSPQATDQAQEHPRPRYYPAPPRSDFGQAGPASMPPEVHQPRPRESLFRASRLPRIVGTSTQNIPNVEAAPIHLSHPSTADDQAHEAEPKKYQHAVTKGKATEIEDAPTDEEKEEEEEEEEEEEDGPHIETLLD